ncbi:helix-turn-helix domain-containing protein [Sphingomonas sp. LR61]|uniref:helix-turn-helix domain-containing protein n=1 Tax=Sphingomonas sp. LR61 TaxID=3050234 RepID=UPI003FA7C88D
MAKAAGKYKGRNRKLTDDQITEARRLISTGVPKTTIARGLGIDRTTLYRMLATPISPAATDAAVGDVAIP